MKSNKVPQKDYCIVDVRDDDRIGGHIKGSHNSPSSDFLNKVDELVKQTKGVQTVIFHCALSQARYVSGFLFIASNVLIAVILVNNSRGPKAARVRTHVLHISLGTDSRSRFTRKHGISFS